jgi:hypothetical protein
MLTRTGDGRAEYLKINPDTGAVECWLNAGSPDGNDGPNAGKVTWIPQGTVATGIGQGAGVRFADLNGIPPSSSISPYFRLTG